MNRRADSTLFVLLAAALAACGTDSNPGAACKDGAPIACSCADGRPGAGVCGVDACDCPPTYTLVAEPGSVDLGEVALGASADATVALHNPAPRAVRLRSIGLLGADAGAFALDGVPVAIPAGGTATAMIRFTASAPGSAVVRLRAEADDDDVAPVEAIVSARVPGPRLSCSPVTVDFSRVWLGEVASASVVCLNVGLAGAADDARLALTALEVAGEGYAAAWQNAPAPVLAVGEAATIALRFEPAAAGEHHGTLAVRGDGIEPATVPLFGFARETPACDVDVVPSDLRFGIIAPGTVQTVGLAFRNNRADAPCTVRDLRLCEGTDPAFTLVGGPYERVLVAGGAEARFELRFAPTWDSCPPEAPPGCVEFDLLPSVGGHRSIPLSCTVPEPSVIVSPSEGDFGTLAAGCASRDLEFQVINTTSVPLVLGELELAAGTGGEFFRRSFPRPGTTIAAGLSQNFTVAYRPEDEGEDRGSVLVWLEGVAEPVEVPLRGRSTPVLEGHDSFQQGTRPKTDVLFVIDNGTSMATESTRVAAELGAIVDRVRRAGVNARFAVTTTGLVAGGPGCPGGVNGGEDGRFFPVDGARPRILDEDTPNLRTSLEANLAVGACHTAPPQALEAAVRALTPPLATSADDPRHDEPDDGNLGFLRPDAHLSVIAVSDRVDASPGTVDAYYQALRVLKGERFAFHAITGDRNTGCTAADGGTATPGNRLLDLVDRTEGGIATAICGSGWLPSSWESPTAPPGIRTCFFLKSQPRDGNGNGSISDADGELRVSIDGEVVPSTTVDGTRVWTYSQEQIAVCFSPLHVPAEGVRIDVDYFVACIAW